MVTHLKFAQNERFLVSASADNGTIKIWDIELRQELHCFENTHLSNQKQLLQCLIFHVIIEKIEDIDIAADMSFIASCSNNCVKAWSGYIMNPNSYTIVGMDKKSYLANSNYIFSTL